MIVQTQTTSFKKELYEGIHNLLTDTIRLALYTALADLDENTLVYTSVNEVVGAGYTAGGNILTGASIGSFNKLVYVSFANTSWPNATFTCRGALIYNASKANRSVAVLNFGDDKIVSGRTFTVQFPLNTAESVFIGAR